jgi:hypothetical protein
MKHEMETKGGDALHERLPAVGQGRRGEVKDTHSSLIQSPFSLPPSKYGKIRAIPGRYRPFLSALPGKKRRVSGQGDRIDVIPTTG